MTLQDLLGGEAAKAADKERSEAQKVQEAAMASIEAESKKSSQATTTEPTAVQQIDFSQYAHKAVSFLARNFYNLKYVALVLAFGINFMLLFYKVTTFGDDKEGSGDSDMLGNKHKREIRYMIIHSFTHYRYGIWFGFWSWWFRVWWN